jgi:hypothetical protein
MKIVKSFEDNIHAEAVKRKTMLNDSYHVQWFWGLGMDGNLYCKCPTFSTSKDWILASDMYHSPSPGLASMKKIIDRFGHLLAFV